MRGMAVYTVLLKTCVKHTSYVHMIWEVKALTVSCCCNSHFTHISIRCYKSSESRTCRILYRHGYASSTINSIGTLLLFVFTSITSASVLDMEVYSTRRSIAKSCDSASLLCILPPILCRLCVVSTLLAFLSQSWMTWMAGWIGMKDRILRIMA